MAPVLPDGWGRGVDPETQLPYYHCTALGATQWEPPGAPPGSAKVMSAMAAAKIEEEFGGAPASGSSAWGVGGLAIDDGIDSSTGTGGTGMGAFQQVMGAGAGAFLQARAASGVNGGGGGGAFGGGGYPLSGYPPPTQPQHAQRGTTTLSAGPVRKRDHDASATAPIAGDPSSTPHPDPTGMGAEDPGGKRPRGDDGGDGDKDGDGIGDGDEDRDGDGGEDGDDEGDDLHPGWAGGGGGGGAGAGPFSHEGAMAGRSGEAPPTPAVAVIAEWERPVVVPVGRPLENMGRVRVPSPPRAHRGGMEERAGDDSDIGPMARPKLATTELPEWRQKALAQDKVKAGEWSNAGAQGKTGPAFGGHIEGAKMDAVRGTAAYLEAMTGKPISVMRIDRKRETHGMQTDGRALF